MSESRPPPGPNDTSGQHVPMPEKPLPATKARQGVTLGHMRWVLLISVVLAIVAMILAYTSVI